MHMTKTAATSTQQFLRPCKLTEDPQNAHSFCHLIEALPDSVLIQTGGKIVFANQSALALHKADSAEQMLGRDMTEFIRPEYLPAVQLEIEHSTSTGLASRPLEVVAVCCDGSYVDVEAIGLPILWNKKRSMVVVLRDIRLRKKAQEAALVWQKRLQLAQKAGLRIGLWDWDLTANTVSWCEETFRQFGFAKDTFSGRVEDALHKLHPKDRGRIEATIQRVLAGETEEYSEQYRLLDADGSITWIHANGVVVRNGSAHMVGIGIDVTEQRNTEQSLRKSEEKYRQLFENATYGVFLAKPDGTLLDANPALVSMLGYDSKEELLTRNLAEDIYENPAERIAVLSQASSGHRVEGFEVDWRRKDGKVFPVRMSGAAALSDEGAVTYEVIVEDITQRRKLEEQYRQSQKMEAVGLLAGGISHDFNNLLGVILGNADLLLDKIQPGSEQRYAEAIKKAGRSATLLVRQLLAFSRKQVLYPTILDLNTVVTELTRMLHRVIGEDVRVVTDLDTNLGTVRADRGQLEQILMNLATNSRDAMPNGGTFSIRTDNAELGSEFLAQYPYIKTGSYVHFAVTDTGVGMSQEVCSRVFEPFFTTKDKGRGTGLGLSMVYGIVKQSGGYIWVSSTPGTGSTFDIYLPRIKDQTAPDLPTAPVRLEYPSGTETILVLEDDQSLRQVTCELLTQSGYQVLQADCPDTAMEVATKHTGMISVIVSDVVLPEMGGPLVVERLQRLHPEMKALYVSGYAEVPVAQQLVAAGAILLQKPVSRKDLLAKVDEILHSQTAGY
jgi:two-component system cell cycle sensor histidine kinase/response regulator CckA